MTWSARDPDTGVYNSSFHRCFVRDPNHLVMFFERRHLWDYYVRAEARNEALPVACVVGHHPAYYLGNCILNGLLEDEYESIGGPSKAASCPTSARLKVLSETLPAFTGRSPNRRWWK